MKTNYILPIAAFAAAALLAKSNKGASVGSLTKGKRDELSYRYGIEPVHIVFEQTEPGYAHTTNIYAHNGDLLGVIYNKTGSSIIVDALEKELKTIFGELPKK